MVRSTRSQDAKRELIVDPYDVQKFYFARLPETIADRVSLERWDRDLTVPAWTKSLRSAEDVAQWLSSSQAIEADSSTPYMLPNDLVKQAVDGMHRDAFPDQLQLGATHCRWSIASNRAASWMGFRSPFRRRRYLS